MRRVFQIALILSPAATAVPAAIAGNGPGGLPAPWSLLAGICLGTGVGFLLSVLIWKLREYGPYGYNAIRSGIAGLPLFETVLTIEWNRNLRTQQPLSVIIAHIDDFKALKDAYGRIRTARCVKAIAGIFNKNLQRAGDFTARYGKTEFIAVLPDTISTEANFLAEKIREGAEPLAMVHCRSTTGKILTVSIGTATMIPSALSDPDDLIVKVKNALIRARNSGGNRVVSIDQETSTGAVPDQHGPSNHCDTTLKYPGKPFRQA